MGEMGVLVSVYRTLVVQLMVVGYDEGYESIDQYYGQEERNDTAQMDSHILGRSIRCLERSRTHH